MSRPAPNQSRPGCRCRALSSHPLIAFVELHSDGRETPEELRRRSRSLFGMIVIQLAIMLALLLMAGSLAQGGETAETESEEETDPIYTYRTNHDPNGIGKFYRGREIARVMSFHGAPWLERQSREEEEKLSLLIKALELKPGMVVADIGAGSGVITVLMADKVGAEGKVMAVDIQQEMLDLLTSKAEKLGYKNIEPVLGTIKDPKLKPESIDLAIMVDVYHEFEFPYEMTETLAKALKPNGRMVLVEYRKEDPRVPIKEVHKMSEKQVKLELGDPTFQLKWKETIDILPRQHIIIFEKQAKKTAE